jgi:short-subunit dehydrogenase
MIQVPMALSLTTPAQLAPMPATARAPVRASAPRRALDAWIARYAQPSAAALDAVAPLKPAVVVTGASRGIGLAIARRFAKAGCDIALLARNAAPLREAAAAIERDFAVSALAVAVDITAADAPQTIDARLAEHGYYTDVIVNSAGIGLSGAFDEHEQVEIEHLIDLNVAALTRLMHHALPGMLGRARGGILNVASIGGLVPGPYQAAYYASKAYVISLTEAVAVENAGSGVRFTAVAPGPVNTGFHALMGAEQSFYRLLMPQLSAGRTASSAYRGYVLGFRVVVPGVLNKLMWPALRILPHRLLLPVVAWLLRPRTEQPWNDAVDSD